MPCHLRHPQDTWQYVREEFYKVGNCHPWHSCPCRKRSVAHGVPSMLSWGYLSCSSPELSAGCKTCPVPWGTVLANSFTVNSMATVISAHTPDSLKLVRACLRDPLTGLWLQCRCMLSLYAPSCAGSFEGPLNTHNTFLKGRNNPFALRG